MGRQVKKTVIKYEANSQKIVQQNQLVQNTGVRANELGQERQRSRQKSQTLFEQNKKEVTVDVNSRKARLEAMKKARQQKEKEQTQSLKVKEEINGNNQVKEIKIVIVGNQHQNTNQKSQTEPLHLIGTKNPEIASNQQNLLQNQYIPQVKIQQLSQKPQNNQQKQNSQNQSSSQQQAQQGPRIIHKPVFLSKEDRSQYHQVQQHQKQKEQQRRKKNLRYTTKILLEESLRKDQEEDSEEEIENNDDDDETNLPDDSDDKNEELEYELWKIRELKRIRRDRQLRQKHVYEKIEIQRRRQMNNEQILLENRLLGSDSTQQQTQTKYVFMQKYYHKGAFYQDSSDPIFQRDYNLPTPMEMQDKSGLPQVLQKRKGNFGKRGQSKYTHLTAEDTTDTNPLTRADESLLNSWKKKMAGYKK